WVDGVEVMRGGSGCLGGVAAAASGNGDGGERVEVVAGVSGVAGAALTVGGGGRRWCSVLVLHVGGSDRSGYGEQFLVSPENSPEKSPAAAGRRLGEKEG
nr:hypothetical protein [Tanacetum cinerariifolium]